jgi:hypothetical protein
LVSFWPRNCLNFEQRFLATKRRPRTGIRINVGHPNAAVATDHSAVGVANLSRRISLAIRIDETLTAILRGALTMFSTHEEDGFT